LKYAYISRHPHNDVSTEIRRLSEKDYDEIIQLWSRANLPNRPRGRDSRSAITAQMRANPDFFIGVYENSLLVGTAIVSSDHRKGWINRLAVDSKYRRQGIGKILVAESEKTLRRHGIRIFCALVEDINTSSKELLKECGYEERHDITYFSKRDDSDV